MPMSLTINSTSPPTGWIPDVNFYNFTYPEPQATDGSGAPCRAIGKPQAQVGMGVMPRAVMAWFMAFFPDEETPSVNVTVGGLFDPRANTTKTYTAKMLRPVWNKFASGWQYLDAVVKFTELVEV